MLHPLSTYRQARVENRTTKMSPVPQRAASYLHAGTLPFGPPPGLARPHRPAPVAQGIEHRPPEAGARVRISPGAPSICASQRLVFVCGLNSTTSASVHEAYTPERADGPRGVHRVGHDVEPIAEKMAVLVERHHRGFVAEHLLDDLHVGTASDRQARPRCGGARAGGSRAGRSPSRPRSSPHAGRSRIA